MEQAIIGAIYAAACVTGIFGVVSFMYGCEKGNKHYFMLFAMFIISTGFLIGLGNSL